MSCPLSFLPEIPEDIATACRWYDERQAGVSQSFLAQLQEVLVRIADSPALYAVTYRDVRAVRLKRFPYVLRYRLVDSTVVVVAVMHAKRHSRAWKGRV